MASTGSCIDFTHQEGRAVSESNVRKMDMWTINSRDLLESLCRKRTRYMRNWRDNAGEKGWKEYQYKPSQR